MEIHNDFDVRAPIDQVWSYVQDVERVAPCMPGAELTEVVDDNTWRGKVMVKMGPVSLSFVGTAVRQEQDDEGHRIVLKADGREQRGKGAASALVVSTLEPVATGTRVSIHTDLTISGAVAQYGRGMLGDISQRLTRQFAECLEANIVAAAQGAGDAVPDDPSPAPRGAHGETPAGPNRASPQPRAAAGPVGGIRLGLWAFWRAVVRFFTRLFGRSG